jgi:hypothetical protein
LSREESDEIFAKTMNDPLPESLLSSPEEEARRQAEYEAALDDARGDTPPAAELRELRDVLRRRQSTLQRDLDVCADRDERERLRRLLNELDEQIGVLDEEAKINRFVEETVKFSHEVRRLSEG